MTTFLIIGFQQLVQKTLLAMTLDPAEMSRTLLEAHMPDLQESVQILQLWLELYSRSTSDP